MMAVSRPSFLSDLTTLPRTGTPLTSANTPKDPPLCDDDELRFRVLSEVETHVQDQLDNMQKASTQENKKSLLQNIYTYAVGYFNKKSQQVQDRWEIPFEDIQELAFVGSGGQGTVFSGIYRGQKIAVKKVNEPKQTEIWQLRKLDHQNIIKFLGVCTKPPCYCVVMEYCCRGNLHNHIRQMELSIPPNQVIQWSNDIASGMTYLHSKRIIHRDLKSLNVLIGEDNSLKISDFGTCRSLDTHTTRITVIGSCSWMAPELIRNEPCNEKVDVWSFGVLLWELLTRQEPYKNLNQGSILYGVGSNKLHLPIPDTCPEDIKQLLNSCWQQKPKCRPSFRQILDQLNLISTGAFSYYTPAQYKENQDTWQQEISAHFDSMKMELDHLSMLSNENSIVSKREEELRHAQEVRVMYEKKLTVAAELCQQLAICKEILAEREHDLDRREKQLTEKYKQFLEDDDSSDSDDSPQVIKSRWSRRKKRSSLKLKQKQDETDVALPLSNKKTIPPSITIPTEEPILRSNSLLTQQGEYSPAVKEFLNSFNDLRLGHSSQVPSPRPSYRRHRRVASYGGFTSKPMASRHSSRSVTGATSKESLNISRKSFDAATNHQDNEGGGIKKTPSHLQFNEPNSDSENVFDFSPCKSPTDDSGREGDDDQSEVEEQLSNIIPAIEDDIPTSSDPLSITPSTLESSTTPTKGSILASIEGSETTSPTRAILPYNGKWNVFGYLQHFLQPNQY